MASVEEILGAQTSTRNSSIRVLRPPRYHSNNPFPCSDPVLTEHKIGSETHLWATESYKFKEFLRIHVGKNTAVEGRSNTDSSSKPFTLIFWPNEHMEPQSGVHDTRPNVYKRNTLRLTPN